MSDGYPGLPDERMTLGLGRPHADDGRAAGVTSPIGPTDAVAVFADLGAYGIDVGDDDLVAPGASSGERAAVVARFTRALDTAGIVVPAVTADLSSHPAFADGAFTAAEPTVRRAALRKAIDAIDLGAELGAELVVLDGGAELATNEAAKDVPTALDCYSEAVKACCAYVEDRGYDVELALALPRDAMGPALLPTVGHVLAFVAQLEQPSIVGVDAVLGPDGPGPPFHVEVAHALWADKLFRVDLGGLPDPGLGPEGAWGSRALRDAFFAVALLEEAEWTGIRHLAAGPAARDLGELRTQAQGRIGTYLLLRAKVAELVGDPEIADARAAAGAERLAERTLPDGPSPESFAVLRDEALDLSAPTTDARDRLDRLVTRLIVGDDRREA